MAAILFKPKCGNTFTEISFHYMFPVFDFNSSPIANAMKNSCGLWDRKIL